MLSIIEGVRRAHAGRRRADEFVLQVVRLSALFAAKGEALARPSGQTLARWVALNAAAEAPATVAEISRRFGFARQSVQRVADLLVEDGLAVYQDNPRHRRAKLLVPTTRARGHPRDQHPPAGLGRCPRRQHR